MRTNVQPFLQVNWKHQFFKDEKMSDLQISPDAKTQQIMRNLGVFFKRTPNSLILGASDKTKSLLENVKGKTTLVFQIQNNDPYFQNRTDIKLYNPAKEFFYFDNLGDDQQIKDVGFLHSDPAVKAESLRQDTGTLTGQIKFEEGNKRISILNYFDEEVWQFEIPDKPERLTVLYSIAEQPQGFYRIKIDDEIRTPFYAKQNSMSHSFAMLHLYLDANMLIKQGDKRDIQFSYEINFKNRAALWRYYFIGANIAADPNIDITGDDFTGQTASKQLLTNGSEAWTMVSNKPLLLHDRYTETNKLSIDLNDPPKRLEDIVLPNPSIETIRGEREGEQTVMYGDMYVYL